MESTSFKPNQCIGLCPKTPSKNRDFRRLQPKEGDGGRLYKGRPIYNLSKYILLQGSGQLSSFSVKPKPVWGEGSCQNLAITSYTYLDTLFDQKFARFRKILRKIQRSGRNGPFDRQLATGLVPLLKR